MSHPFVQIRELTTGLNFFAFVACPGLGRLVSVTLHLSLMIRSGRRYPVTRIEDWFQFPHIRHRWSGVDAIIQLWELKTGFNFLIFVTFGFDLEWTPDATSSYKNSVKYRLLAQRENLGCVILHSDSKFDNSGIDLNKWSTTYHHFIGINDALWVAIPGPAFSSDRSWYGRPQDAEWLCLVRWGPRNTIQI
jgi:hypothetical protein